MKSAPVEIFHVDITTLAVDAIVNAAYTSLPGVRYRKPFPLPGTVR